VINNCFVQRLPRTVALFASVVDIDFLFLGYKQISAFRTPNHSTIDKVVSGRLFDVFSNEYALSPIKQILMNYGLMYAGKRLSPDIYHAEVEGVMQNRGQSVDRYLLSVPITQPQVIQMIGKIDQTPITVRVEFKGLTDQGPGDRVNNLGFARSAVQITYGRSEREQALL
jgi:hypothetical protein